MMTWALQLVFLSVLFTFRMPIAKLFLPYAAAGSAELMALLDCMMIIAVGSIGDWTNCALAGALQGAGRQTLGAVTYACTHWGLGIALLWLFAFQLGWEVRGVWAALAVASNVQCLLMGVRTKLERLVSLLCTCGKSSLLHGRAGRHE
jgi:Na+-driven multidrug efflux pump